MLDEAARAISDKSRALATAQRPEILNKFFEAGRAATNQTIAGSAALGARGAAMAPAVIRAIGAHRLVHRRSHQRRIEAHEARLQEAIRKQDALLRALQQQNAASAERVEYLEHLVSQLQVLIEGLTCEVQAAEYL